MKFRYLNADEINVRVQSVTTKGKSCWLLYKDARCDMNILDETLGAMNWQRDHKELKGNIYCGVSVWDAEKSQWITKWDCGAESMADAEKGEASDSFKRACFNIGIGRELYTSPTIWIDLDANEFEVSKTNTGKEIAKSKNIYLHVSSISYHDGKINGLVIKDSHGKVRFKYLGENPCEDKKSNVGQNSSLNADLVKELNELGITLEQVADYKKINVNEITDSLLVSIIATKRRNLAKAGKQ